VKRLIFASALIAVISLSAAWAGLMLYSQRPTRPVPGLFHRSKVDRGGSIRWVYIGDRPFANIEDLPGISANAGENGPRPVRRPTNPGMLAPKNGRANIDVLLAALDPPAETRVLSQPELSDGKDIEP
jgi:hypothetical protein